MNQPFQPTFHPPRVTVPCKWCRQPTEMLGMRECDSCHELRVLISMNPEPARAILAKLDVGEPL